MNDIEPRLVGCFEAVFPDLDRSQITSATPETVEGWDSVSTITLLSLIEEEFDASLLGEDPEKFSSFARLLIELSSRSDG